jgi:hypothetical protein
VGGQNGEIVIMKEMLEKLKDDAPELFKPIIQVTQRVPMLGFAPLQGRLLIASVQQTETLIDSVRFEDEPERRSHQIRESFAMLDDRLTLPVGVVFVGLDEKDPALGVDKVMLVARIVDLIAAITGDPRQTIANNFSWAGAVIADLALRELNLAEGKLGVIIEAGTNDPAEAEPGTN